MYLFLPLHKISTFYTKFFMKNRLLIAIFSTLIFWGNNIVSAQETDVYKQQRQQWLKKAENAIPPLIKQIKKPISLVKAVKDTSAYQGWKTEKTGDINRFYRSSFKQNNVMIVDFGEHLTGTFSCTFDTLGNISDAPVRFKLTFAEMPAELGEPFDPYQGSLSRAWLQDEIVTLQYTPYTVTIPRRLAFRYVKIELLAASSYFDVCVSDMKMEATSCVQESKFTLAPETDPLIKEINRVGLSTLKECMQTVYEDGPKRDMRLWIGDLYLEALANAYSYQNNALTKRCLYLLAALAKPSGILNANISEVPTPRAQNSVTLDYCLLYNVALHEYLKASGDKETAEDLWPVAVNQLFLAQEYLNDEGLYDTAKQPQYWLVFDWKDNFDRHASIQGLMTFAFNETYQLAKLLGKENEVKELPRLISKMKKASRKYLYDKKQGVFVSGQNKQISYLSQAWMTLSETLPSKECAKALQTAVQNPEACYPGSPYGYHYVIEALIKCGLGEKARDMMAYYWGGMVKKGADTFWEVYDPKDDCRSPYNSHLVNSYCHAWSCTPVYFINKYPEIFQK